MKLYENYYDHNTYKDACPFSEIARSFSGPFNLASLTEKIGQRNQIVDTSIIYEGKMWDSDTLLSEDRNNHGALQS